MPNILKHLSKGSLYVLSILEEAGYEAYIIGGAVRDALLNRHINDFDICTNAKPEKVSEIFTNNDFKVIEIGIKHGTVSVLKNNVTFEITTYRVDGEYLDSRHPKCVSFDASLEEDVKRRDFTINALACDKHGNVIDYVGGLNDINKHIIRTVGDPIKRFSEDALRMLRAIRFSKTLSFEIEEETKNAILELSNTISNISIERINDEFKKIICYPFKDTYLTYKELFDCAYRINYQFNLKELNMCDNFPDNKMKIAFFISSMKNINKDEYINSLKISNDKKKLILNYINNSMTMRNKQFDDLFLKKILSNYGLTNGYFIIQYLCYYNNVDILLIKEKINDIISDVVSISDLDVNGNDIKALGYKGNEIGTILNGLVDQVLTGKVKNERNALIKIAPKMLKSLNNDYTE